MKNIILVLVLFVGSILSTKACDVCGCALGSMSLAVLPESNSHFIGMRYTYASFNAQINYNSMYVEDVYSNDTYNRAELFGRYHFTQRFSATAILPYILNNMAGNTQEVTVNGVGDPTLLASYQVLTAKENILWKQNLILSIGASLPVGENEFRDGEELVNRNFQPGKGTFSTVFNLNYLLKKNKIGVNTEMSYMINSRNKDDYLFGDQFNTSLNFFYLLQKEKYALMPMLGVYAEHAQEHLDGKYRVINSGGNTFFGSVGFQFYLNKFILNGNILIPVKQNYNTDNLTSIESYLRFTLGLRYNIGTKE